MAVQRKRSWRDDALLVTSEGCCLSSGGGCGLWVPCCSSVDAFGALLASHDYRATRVPFLVNWLPGRGMCIARCRIIAMRRYAASRIEARRRGRERHLRVQSHQGLEMRLRNLAGARSARESVPALAMEGVPTDAVGPEAQPGQALVDHHVGRVLICRVPSGYKLCWDVHPTLGYCNTRRCWVRWRSSSRAKKKLNSKKSWRRTTRDHYTTHGMTQYTNSPRENNNHMQITRYERLDTDISSQGPMVEPLQNLGHSTPSSHARVGGAVARPP